MARLDDIFTRERGRVLGALTRAFSSLDLAEEAFSAAVVSALETWTEPPENPGAWLTLTAKNHARDVLRHRRVVDAKAILLEDHEMHTPDSPFVHDDQLRLIFTCCHPALPEEQQVALTLKVVCGFETDELARAFVCSEATISQRIVRAKRLIEDRQLPYIVPDHKALPERLSAVLGVVYLIFNAGYSGRHTSTQAEALRLGRLLGELMPGRSEVYSLYAMMAFAASRANTRTDANGRLVLLADQDRSQWDRALIKEALVALVRARSLGGGGAYALQAEIACCHATAPSWDQTDWAAILALYDAMPSTPVIALNRAVAVCMLDGPEAGLRAIGDLEPALARYHLFYATRADFLRRQGADPRADYTMALALTADESERAFLRERLSVANGVRGR